MVTPAPEPVVVIDFGSGFTKAGFAGNDAPTIVFPTIIGKPKGKGGPGEILVGEAALTAADAALKRPIVRGVFSFEDLPPVSAFVFQSLGVKPENSTVLVARPPGMPAKGLEQLARHFFDQLHVVALAIVSSSTLALLSTGRVTGLVAEVGYGITNVVPIFESFGIEHARITSELGGSDVDSTLRGLLKKIGMSENDHAAVMEVKEQLCFVKRKEAEVEAVAYELPSGQKLSIGQERVAAPELIFDPSLVGKESAGLADAIAQSITRCDHFLREELMPNIVVSGGSSMFPGLAERVEADVSEKLIAGGVAAGGKITVIAAPERKYGVWIGGSIFASTPVFPVFLIKKVDLESQGQKIFRQRSFMS
jgi:actin-related protein